MSQLEQHARAVRGLRVGVGQSATCGVCGETIRPNEPIEVLVLFRDATIEIVATRCLYCARSRIRPQTERECWLVRGILGGSIDARGRSEVVLERPVVIDRNG